MNQAMDKIQIDYKEYEQLKPLAKIILNREYSIMLILEGIAFEYMLNEEQYEQKEKEEIIVNT
jgi:hypothetical protein